MLTSGAEDIAAGEFPHPGEKLDKTAGEDGHTDDNVGGCDPSGLYVDKGKDESRGCKGK